MSGSGTGAADVGGGAKPGVEADLSSYIASANARIAAHKHYPELAEQRGIEGKVTVRFVIDQTGAVTSTTVAHSVDPLLDDAAIDAVKEAAPFPRQLAGPREVNLEFRLDPH